MKEDKHLKKIPANPTSLDSFSRCGVTTGVVVGRTHCVTVTATVTEDADEVRVIAGAFSVTVLSARCDAVGSVWVTESWRRGC